MDASALTSFAFVYLKGTRGVCNILKHIYIYIYNVHVYVRVWYRVRAVREPTGFA